MKVTFADSFFESLETIRRHDTWWYKIYETLRYDIPRFFKTIWKFRKELYKYYEWDHSYALKMLNRSLVLLADHIEEHGNEIDESRLKKVAQMRRAIEILELHSDGSFIEEAEKELGYECNTEFTFRKNEPEEIKKANKKIFDLSNKIEEETWKELFVILQGQDYKDFDKIAKKIKEVDDPVEHFENRETAYREWFDGSGMKGWWD